jgi:hypothetical protein
MNCFLQFKESIWVAAGSATGLAVGMGANLIRTSDNTSACSSPFNGFIPFAAINEVRQRILASTYLLNPFIPLIHTAPMSASSLWKTFNPTPGEKDKNVAIRAWKNVSKLVLNPLIHQNLLLCGSLFAKSVIFPRSNPSLHVIFHAANTLNAIKSLEGLSSTESPTQKKTLFYS